VAHFTALHFRSGLVILFFWFPPSPFSRLRVRLLFFSRSERAQLLFEVFIDALVIVSSGDPLLSRHNFSTFSFVCAHLTSPLLELGSLFPLPPLFFNHQARHDEGHRRQSASFCWPSSCSCTRNACHSNALGATWGSPPQRS